MDTPELTFFRSLGKNIRLYRKGQNLNQTKLAEASGITCQQLQKKETGEQRISVWQLAQVARALDIPVGQLLEGTAFSGLSSLEKRNWELIQENTHLKKLLQERTNERDNGIPQTRREVD